MKLRAKQILSASLATSLVWAFVSCAFLCSENADCAEEDSGAAAESRAVSFENPTFADSCSISEAVKTTAPERLSVNLNLIAGDAKVSQPFAGISISKEFFKYRTVFNYSPPVNSGKRRSFILRI